MRTRFLALTLTLRLVAASCGDDSLDLSSFEESAPVDDSAPARWSIEVRCVALYD